jgi:hypothetical protein
LIPFNSLYTQKKKALATAEPQHLIWFCFQVAIQS